MSSACSVPAATATAHTLAPASGDLELRRSSAHPATPPSPGPISYEGRVSVLAPNVAADPSFHFRPAAAFMNLPQQPNGRSASEFDEAVLRRIKAECDNMLDINGLHKEDGYQSGFLDMGNLPVYSGRTGSGVGMPFPPHFNAQANALSQYYTPPHPQRSPEVPVKQERRSPVNDYLGGEHSDHHEDQPSRARHDDSGVSPGTSGSDCVDPGEGKEAMVRGESSSPFSESGQYSNDDRPSASVLEEDDDVMDEDDEDMDGAEVATVSGSDLVGDALSRLQRALQSNGVLRSGREASSPGAEGPDGEGPSSQEVFQCHLCSYSGTSRFHFQAHINTHFDVKCSHCDFTARTEGKLRAHMKSAHGVMPEEGDESTLRVPRVNAQGKVKTFKCKQCNFVAVTKLDFWEHSRTHIKAEKLLTCPKCPFVTEYKHHLEYHMRNHFGSKPFKCPKCSYSCVNKSMLNSHMKSHSNVYQYRCADCAYATKYCHSLKLHLRKYGHTPAVAISGDGPGRGSPMMEGSVSSSGRKSSKKRGDSDSRHSRDHPSSSPMSGQGLPSAGPVPPAGFLGLPNPFGGPQGLPYGFPLSLLANGYPGHPLLNGMGPAPSLEESKLVEENTEVSAPKKSRRDPSPQRTSSPLKCNICDFSSTHKETFSQHLLAHAAVENRDLANLFGVNADNLEAESKNSSTPAPVASLPGPSPSSVSARSSPQAPQVNDYISRMFTNPLLFAPGIVPGMVSHNSLLQPRLPIKEREDNEPVRSPASSPAQSPPATPKETRDEGEQQRSSTVPLDLSRERDDQAPTSGKNRRKGQAFKLERIAVRLQERRSPAPGSVNSSPSDHRGDEEETDDMDNESQYSSRRASFGSGLAKPSRGTSEAIQEPSSPNEWTGAYQCSYCDIAFKDPVMYTMHMGYHGYKDPFKCNMCGQQTNDKLAFFLHIARSSHV